MKISQNPQRHLAWQWQRALLPFVIIAYFAATTITSFFYRLSGLEIFLGIVIYLVTICPILRWIRQKDKSLPLMEFYLLFCLLYYVHPILATNVNYGMWTETIRIKTSAVVLVFVGTIEIVHFSFRRKAPIRRNQFLDRRLPLSSSMLTIWFTLLLWVFLTMVQVGGWSWIHLGNVGVVACKAAGLLSLFYLAVDFGNGRLQVRQRLVFVGLSVFTIALQCAGGFLFTGAASMIVLVIGYTVGAKKVPVIGTLLGFLIFSYLHIGKGEMRERFWNYENGQGVAVTPSNLFEIYHYWNDASWQALTKEATAPEQVLLERLNLFQMVALSVDHFPSQRDYLGGETYASYPLLFIPRFLWPNKPRVDGPSQTLAIATDIQTEETMESTAISFGMLSEGWANFGWCGVVGLGFFLAILLTGADRLCAGRRIDSLGFIIGVSVLSNIASFELVLGQWLLNLVQLTSLAIIAALLMSGVVPTRTISRRFTDRPLR